MTVLRSSLFALLAGCALVVAACGTGGTSRNDGDGSGDLIDAGDDTAMGDATDEDTSDEDVPPDEDVPEADVPREDVPDEDVPDEDVPEEDAPTDDIVEEDVVEEDAASDVFDGGADADSGSDAVTPGACERPRDCMGGQTCVDGLCRAICSRLIPCEDDAVPDCDLERGICVECVSDGSCGRGRICNDGLCASRVCEAGTAGCEEACMDVFPSEIDFGSVPVDGRATREVTIEYCADVRRGPAIELDTLITTDGAGDPTEAFNLLDAPDLPFDLTPGVRRSFEVEYTPSGDEDDSGLLVIDGDEARRIDLLGNPSMDECPVAVVDCWIGDISRTGPDAEDADGAVQFDTLYCTGIDSFHPDETSRIVGYEWDIVERPRGSTTMLAPSSTSTNPSLFLDESGRYVLRLTVRDQNGVQSCSSSEFVVDVSTVEDSDIWISLTWFTEEDLIDDTTGTDFDLHLLHPSGTWRDMMWDCHWASRDPDWGTIGDRSDDPSLVRDDLDGQGPEIIYFQNPTDEVTYRVGVHYWSDHSYGPSDATLEIRIDGVEQLRIEDFTMTDRQFWDVAGIVWPEGEIILINDLLPDLPGSP